MFNKIRAKIEAWFKTFISHDAIWYRELKIFKRISANYFNVPIEIEHKNLKSQYHEMHAKIFALQEKRFIFLIVHQHKLLELQYKHDYIILPKNLAKTLEESAWLFEISSIIKRHEMLHDWNAMIAKEQIEQCEDIIILAGLTQMTAGVCKLLRDLSNIEEIRFCDCMFITVPEMLQDLSSHVSFRFHTIEEEYSINLNDTSNARFSAGVERVLAEKHDDLFEDHSLSHYKDNSYLHNTRELKNKLKSILKHKDFVTTMPSIKTKFTDQLAADDGENTTEINKHHDPR